jgi:hypothetical protein
MDKKCVMVECSFPNQFFVKAARPFPGAIIAMPNSSSEISFINKDMAEPAYNASPKPFRQTMNPKTLLVSSDI